MFLYVSIFALVIALYVIIRAILPLRAHRAIKLILSLITLAAAGKFHLFYLIEGKNFYTPDLPPLMIWGGCWLFSAVCGYALLLAAADAIRLPLYLLLWLARHRPADTWRRVNNSFNLSLLLLILATAAWGTWCGTRPPQVRSITIPVASLQPQEAPIRIVQLTDLHADSTKDAAFYRDIVQKTNALNPDVVVITGDFADGPPERFGSALAPLRELDAPMGVYAVAGNHDCFHKTREWLALLRRYGVNFIDGEVMDVSCEQEGIPRKELQLIGLHDPVAARFSHGDIPGIEELAQKLDSGTPSVLLAHRPGEAPQAAACGIDLQLSGHTHGGQFPGLQQLVAAANNGYVYGLYRVGNMQLYVSPGTSLWTPACLRLGIPPEITLLTLTPAGGTRLNPATPATNE